MSETTGNDPQGNISPEEHQVTESKAVQVSTSHTVVDVTTEPVDDKLVEEAVKFINETAKETIYRGYLKIGKYLFEKFYDGDIERVRSRNPKKKGSLRKLMSEDLPVHISTLHNAIRVTAQEYFFAEHNVDTSQVTYTHLCELVKLPDNDEKIQLLQRLIGEKMSTRQLATDIHKIRTRSIEPPTGEPEVILAPSQLIKDLKGLFDPKMTKRLDMKPEEVKTLEAEQRIELKGKVAETLTKLQEVARACKKILLEIKTTETEEKRKK
ncbi:MAG: hypothetical protein ACLQVJ_23965 [Syntrophobacteraceae bacterium]